jgi:hypothetical protein
LNTISMVVLVLHVLFLIWASIIDNFARIDRWFSRFIWPWLPRFLKGVLWGMVLPESSADMAQMGSVAALLYYLVRGWGSWRQNAKEKTEGKWKVPSGWGIDGIMNIAGPLLVHIWTWTL